MNKRFLIILISIFSCFLSCTTTSKTLAQATDSTTKQQAIDYEKQGYIPAKVIRYAVDGCQYLIELRSGKHLEAVNMAQELKQDQLEIWIKYGFTKQTTSICMGGDIVTITDYKIVK